MTPKNLIIDTDGGVDDVLALLMAVAHPSASLAEIWCVFGNGTRGRAARNVGAVLREAGGHIRLRLGAEAPLDGRPWTSGDGHGPDGLWGGTRHLALRRGDADAPRLRFHGALRSSAHYLGIGPATNLAQALRVQGSSLRTRLRSVTLMAGAVGNNGMLPSAETNARTDPKALEAVLETGLVPRLIGLNVTRRVVLAPAEIREMVVRVDGRTRPRLTRMLRCALGGYARHYRRQRGLPGCPPHDAVALIATVHPELFAFERLGVRVLTMAPRTGRTVISGGGAPADVAVDVDAVAVKDVLLSAF